MHTHAVAFDTLEEPSLVSNPDPSNCFVFTWDVAFFATRSAVLTLRRSADAGHVIQRVTIRKSVFDCTNQRDKDASDACEIIKSFTLRKGECEGNQTETSTDSAHIGCLNHRHTFASTRLEAAYRKNLDGLTVLDAFTGAKEYISDGDVVLKEAPADFSPTLTRTINLFADCCGATPFCIMEARAYNSDGTYSKAFRQTLDQKRENAPSKSMARLSKPSERFYTRGIYSHL